MNDLSIELVIDQKKITLNEFIKNVFERINIGVVTSLHGIPDDWKEITIKITRQ